MPPIIKQTYIKHKDETTILFQPDQGSGEMEMTISDKNTLKKIRFRNVGDRNTDASLQFSYTEYNKRTNRTKHASFSVPAELADVFLYHINTIDNGRR